MDSQGTKLAIAIMIMWIAMVFFFFAFHPGGVENVSNPAQMLQWLMNEFGNIVGAKTGTTSAASTATAANTAALNYPGYTSGSSDVGTATPSGASVD